MSCASGRLALVFDFAMVGLGHSIKNLQTGVYRYCLELAKSLVQRPDLSVEFAASRDSHLAQHALAEIPEFRGFPLVRAPFTGLRESLLTLLESNRQSLPKVSPKFGYLDWFILRASLAGIRHVVPKFAPTIAPQILKNARVYHSPWFAIPKDLPAKPRLKRFLSILDLIPIRFPYFFSGSEEQDLRKKIGSLNASDFVLCISSSTRDDLLNFRPRLDPSRVFVSYPGVSDAFHPVTDAEEVAKAAESAGVPRGCRYLLSLCTLEPRKNLQLLLKAFGRLAGTGDADDLFLVLAGGRGWLIEPLFEQLEASAKIRARILLPGRIPDKALPALYSGAEAFVYPSLYEGFGLPPLEAMRCGTPVVVARTSSLPEVVGESGLYCDPRDEESLADALRKLLRDGGLRRSLGEAGRAASQKFTWEACASATVSAYQAAISM